MALWRGMDRASLDAAYNNREAVPGSAEITAGWRARSAAFRAAHPQHLDLPYGATERQRIDFSPPAGPALRRSPSFTADTGR